ncbi:MAG TPA: CdaR family protein [Dissulfurispiraceae bacterium]|nr:CdaR family protein [Dissulfurispiraceae bacterium]
MAEKPKKNIGLKILSVALAITLWFYVSNRGESETSVEAQIDFKNIPAGMEILRQSMRKATVNVQGYEQEIYRLRSTDVRVVVDLGSAKKGETMQSLVRENVVLPRSLKVLRIEPATIKVSLDETATRTLQVKPHITGTPERPFELKSATAKPSAVKIEGPRSEIEKISVLRTDPIDITGLDEDFTQNAKLNLGGRGLRSDVADVSVSLTIRKAGK